MNELIEEFKKYSQYDRFKILFLSGIILGFFALMVYAVPLIVGFLIILGVVCYYGSKFVDKIGTAYDKPEISEEKEKLKAEHANLS